MSLYPSSKTPFDFIDLSPSPSVIIQCSKSPFLLLLIIPLITDILLKLRSYRIGAPGFLYSPEMEIAGYRPNNGLEDQRLGLYWIRRYISGFGGDPERVTFLGESAGAGQ